MLSTRRLLLPLLLVASLPSTAPGQTAAVVDRADRLVFRARSAAGDDKHARAIALFKEAFVVDPGRRTELAREVGLQFTWNEQPDSAIHWFEIYLESHPGDAEAQIGIARALSWAGRYDESLQYYARILEESPDLEEARINMAKVQGWADRLSEAAKIYDEILAEDPDNAEARQGLAHIVNWSGRHRQAVDLLEEVVAEDPDNSDARIGLAQAYYWMGRPDLAKDLLRGVRDDARSKEIESTIDGDRVPSGGYGYDNTRDSDDIERRIHWGEVSGAPSYLTRTTVRISGGDITEPLRPAVNRQSLSVELSQTVNNTFAFSLRPGYQWNWFDRYGPEPFWQDEFNLSTFEGHLAVRPNDAVYLDFGFTHTSLDNPIPTFRGISLSQYGASMDLRLDATRMTATGLSITDYSDDNRRIGLSQIFLWRPEYNLSLPGRPRPALRTGIGYIDFSQQPDHGYFSPDRYLTVYESIELEASLSQHVSARASGRLGLDRENSSDWFTAGSFGGSLSLHFGGAMTLTAGYDNSKSRLDTQSGYQAEGFYFVANFALRK